MPKYEAVCVGKIRGEECDKNKAMWSWRRREIEKYDRRVERKRKRLKYITRELEGISPEIVGNSQEIIEKWKEKGMGCQLAY